MKHVVVSCARFGRFYLLVLTEMGWAFSSSGGGLGSLGGLV